MSFSAGDPEAALSFSKGLASETWERMEPAAQATVEPRFKSAKVKGVLSPEILV